MNREQLYSDAIQLLQKLISTPSFSKEEENTAAILESFFHGKNIPVNRHLNNVWAVNKYFDNSRPTLLLNSHHDTVKPNPGYTHDPFEALIEGDKLFGLGSNDAGGCLVSLIAAFCYYYEKENLAYNLLLGASAEEEISGRDGIEILLSVMPKIDLAIVGEPTETQLAVAEKGLLVLDCEANGKAGHAARDEGENAIYNALQDIEWFRYFRFPNISKTLGAVKMSVTSIVTENKAHNVVPATCNFIVDIRVTDEYTHEEVLEIVKKHVSSTVTARSMRMRSSHIDIDHPLVQAGIHLGKTTYGSPTSSDAAFIPVPVLKCGPGNSARSHTADEYIHLHEIKDGINTYIDLIEPLLYP